MHIIICVIFLMGRSNICWEKISVPHQYESICGLYNFINLLCRQLIWENTESSQCLKEDKAVMSFC